MFSPMWSVLVRKIPEFWTKATSSNSSSYLSQNRHHEKIHVMLGPLSGAENHNV